MSAPEQPFVRVDESPPARADSPGGRIRVVHVITALNVGGAENMLYKVLTALDRERFEPSVISLADAGVVGERIRALGIPVEAVGLRPGTITPAGLLRLGRLLRSAEPDVVQTWLYHADLLGGVMARVMTPASVIWGLRQALDPRHSKRHTLMVAKLCARLSAYVPARIVSCSQNLVDIHARMGYARGRMQVIPNGFDDDRLQPDPSAALTVRRELGIPADGVMVGLPARYHPQKDHPTFIRATREATRTQGNVWFVLCGMDVDDGNEELVSLIRREGVPERTRLLGRRDDISRLMSAFDVVVSSSSFGEGFANVLGEAMACGTPCVSTDVGDARYIIDGTGHVVAPKDPERLAEAICALIRLSDGERAEVGRRARDRIVTEFSLGSIVERFEELYVELRADRSDRHL